MGDGRGKVACRGTRAGARAGLGHVCLMWHVLMCHAQSQGVPAGWVWLYCSCYVCTVEYSVLKEGDRDPYEQREDKS